MTRRFLLSDGLVVAAWTAALGGLVEGLLLVVSRNWPQVLASHKASVHLLWIAPLMDIAVFGLLAIAYRLIVAWLPARVRQRALLWCFGVFIFCAVATAALALNVIHVASTVILALGAALWVVRTLDGREESAARQLRKRLLYIPIVIGTLALSVAAFEFVAEEMRYAHLPAPGIGDRR